MFNELALPSDEAKYREEFLGALDKLKLILTSFNLIGPQHNATDIGLCQRRPRINVTSQKGFRAPSFQLREDHVMMVIFGCVTIITAVGLILHCYCKTLNREKENIRKLNESKEYVIFC